MSALTERTRRVLTVDEASTVAGYVRALGGIARARHSRGGGDLGRKSMDELIAEAMQVPELRAAIESMGGGQ